MARDKRGSHLALSMERLNQLCIRRPVRIGLSATQRPIEEIARFLVGSDRVAPKGTPDCTMVDVGHNRKMDLGIEIIPSPLSAVCSNQQWEEIYKRLSEMVRIHRSTLIFVNTRRLAERVTHHLTELLGPDAVSSHHGSLSKKIRLKTERRLKAGELKAVIATASLELGIDIGFIDLVIQIGSPRSIATFLQRVGRSGHALGLVPKGRLVALTRDELIECAALLRAVTSGRLDQIEIPEAPLDILAQQIIAEVASREIIEENLYQLCTQAWPYRHLTRTTFDNVVQMLSDGFTNQFGKRSAYLHLDRVNQTIRPRRGSRLAALTSGGAIPELADYRVVSYPEKIVVGSVDEDFAVESMSGDIFLLGNTSWQILQVRSGEVGVQDAHGAPPSIPFWRGEAPARTLELSEEISILRRDLSQRIHNPDEALAWLRLQIDIPESGAQQIIDYLQAQKAAIGLLPSQEHIVFERFFDESGGMQLVIHSPFGGRINRAWGLSLRKSFCRTFDFELQSSADDNGIVISLGPQQSFPLESVSKMVNSANAKKVLEQALLAAPMFMTRWRWNANRSLAVLRQRGGKRIPPPIQRMQADDLMVKVFPQQMACRENLPQGDIPIPDHPLVFQTVYDCLHEAMDSDGWIKLLKSIEEGRIQISAVDTREPSPFSYEILNANPYAFLDDAPLEERRARAVSTRRTLTIESIQDIGKLDPHAIDQVKKEAWPLIRNPDELHETLSQLGILSRAEGEQWGEFYQKLFDQGRALEASGKDKKTFWVPTELWPMVRAARPDLIPNREPIIPEGVRVDWSASEGWVNLVNGRLEILGPTTTDEISSHLGLDPSEVESALFALEGQGLVLRGHFRPLGSGTEWCSRHLLTRIHRLTLNRIRRQIQPATVEQFFQFLFRWQHIEPGTQLQGTQGLASTIEQLQGFEIPAMGWEQVILPQRVLKYKTEFLDNLCLNGEVAWGRISFPLSDSKDLPNRIRSATKILPVSLMIREDLWWLRPGDEKIPEQILSHGARATLEVLQKQGASFFADLIKTTGLLPTQQEETLWELVAAGLITGDGFAGIRSLSKPLQKHQEAVIRRLKRRGRAVHALRRGAGRWTLFNSPQGKTQEEKEESLSAWAGQLLERYGILFRDLLAREDCAPPWYALRPILKRMEARGEVYGGRFVSSVSGEQFALPHAVETLRHLRQENKAPTPSYISGVDPLNLIGIVTPGPRLPALSSNIAAFYGGAHVGSSKGGEVWISGVLEPDQAKTVKQVLTSGRILSPSP